MISLQDIMALTNVSQIKNSFDGATILKIAKGSLIAGTGAAALYFLEGIGSIQIDNVNTAAIVSFMVPLMVNVIKEYVKGE